MVLQPMTIEIKNQDLVTVIIPVFNRKRSIKRAISSVLKQTYENVEIIVVDDGSTDETVTVIEKMKTNYHNIRLVKCDTNRGGGAARNFGIERASGEIVAFLDSDDYWLPHKLERQVALFMKTPDIENSIIYCRAIKKEGPDSRIITPDCSMVTGECVLEYLFCSDGFIQTSSMLMHRKLALRVKFRTIPRHQDYDFCIRAQRMGAEFIMDPEPGYVWDNQAYPDRISRQFDALESLKWALGISSFTVQAFEGYINRHKIFVKIAKEKGLGAALIRLIDVLFKRRISLEYFTRASWQAFWRAKQIIDRAPESDLLLNALRKQKVEIASVYGAGNYFQEILPYLLDQGIKIAHVVDRKASEGDYTVNGYPVVTLIDAINSGANCFIIASHAFSEQIRNDIVSAWPKDRLPPQIYAVPFCGF
jgi:glycosyltransferase involved in cell wall biosynthesis